MRGKFEGSKKFLNLKNNDEDIYRRKFRSISFICVVLFSAQVFAIEDSAALLSRVRSHISTHDDNSEVEMTIVESNGSKKVRKLRLQTFQDAKFHAIAEILSPVDVKGTAVLSEVDKNQENQWLYTPSSRQVRRLMNVKSSGGVLGSEITMEDLNSTAVKSLRSTIRRREHGNVVIELIPKSGTSLYERVLVTVSEKLEIPLKTIYFQKGRIVKTVEFSNYKKYGSIYRAQNISVQNLANHRGTDLRLLSYKNNPGLSAVNFNPSRLKDN